MTTLFASVWNSTNPAAEWGGIAGNNENYSVASAASLGLTGWPTSNAFRVGVENASTFTDPTSIRTLQTYTSGLGTVTSGSHRYFRVYQGMLYSDNHGSPLNSHFEHGMEHIDAGSTGSNRGSTIYRVPTTSGTWWAGYLDYINNWRWRADSLLLNKNATYRLEWHIAYGSTAITVEIRVYSSDDSLVVTTTDFVAHVGTTENLAAAAIPWTPATHGGYWDAWRMGTNGPGSNYPLDNLTAAEEYLAHGAAAVSDSDWLGAYGSTGTSTGGSELAPWMVLFGHGRRRT